MALYPPILPLRLKARTRLHRVQIMMPHNQRTRKAAFQLPQQGKQRGFLFRGAGVGGTALSVQPSFVADADGVAVVVQAVRTCLFQRAAAVYHAVARHVEVVADVAEATVADVVEAAVFEAQRHALRRG